MPNKHVLSDFLLDRETLHTSSRDRKIGGSIAINLSDYFSQRAICNTYKVIEDCMKTIAVNNRKVQIGCIFNPKYRHLYV